MALVPLTILHSNDMHGDFLAEARGPKGRLIGGLALLSGYLNQVRANGANSLFVVAGDMLQGSVIDSEYKGCSTMEMMNYLAPDVVALGNHDFDYGLPHLLFLEKLTHFPIVSANLYIKPYHRRLMQPFCVVRCGGIKVLFIGIITEQVLDAIGKDELISAFVTLTDASEETGRIINAHKGEDIDLTVLLTHIGFEDDKKLAGLLRPEWGVDMIIGGHSHTVLEQPEVVNNILIAQAGVGTDQIGRFDLVVDTDRNRIAEYNWRLIPIDEELAPADTHLEKFIDSFREEVDRKYKTLLCHFARQLTHPSRFEETELGNLAADLVAEASGADVVLIGSGSVRQKELGPVVTLGDFHACYPFDDPVTKFTVDGRRLSTIFSHILNPEIHRATKEFYQTSAGVRAVFDKTRHLLTSLNVRQEPVVYERSYSLCLTEYHVQKCEAFLGVSAADLSALAPPRVVSTSLRDVLEERLRGRQNTTSKVEGRLVVM